MSSKTKKILFAAIAAALTALAAWFTTQSNEVGHLDAETKESIEAPPEPGATLDLDGGKIEISL